METKAKINHAKKVENEKRNWVGGRETSKRENENEG